MAASTKKVIFVVGPTAGGKSAEALKHAQTFGGSIVNVDSVQFYKGLEIGSAAPTAAEKELVPHHLYSYVNAPEEMTAGKYVENFYQLLENADLKFPLFIVGGTGFYIQALEKGLFDIEPIPKQIRSELEAELEARGAEALFTELHAKDPQTKIHPNDHYRLVRALEILRHTSKIPSQMKSEQDYKKNIFPFPFLKVGYSFEKDEFLMRVQKRSANIIRLGLIAEAEHFMLQNQEHWAPLSSVGYKEAVQYLREKKTKDWLQENVVVSTMQLIKKQKTWFKRDPSILWSDQSLHIRQFLHDD